MNLCMPKTPKKELLIFRSSEGTIYKNVPSADFPPLSQAYKSRNLLSQNCKQASAANFHQSLGKR